MDLQMLSLSICQEHGASQGFRLAKVRFGVQAAQQLFAFKQVTSMCP